LNGFVGQLTDPYAQGEDDEGLFTLSGLPGEPLEPDEPVPGPDPAVEESEELVFELDDWSEIERDAVTDRLREAGVPHWWVESTLHVAETDRSEVEAVLDDVAADADALDPERDQVAYDMEEWSDDRIAALADQLDEAGIDYGWDGDELFVYASDEQAVDELIDKTAHPHELPAEADDGEQPGGELLGELFVVADRLSHDAEDNEARTLLIDLAEAAGKGGPPYGLDARDWGHLRERVDALADLLREDKLDVDAALAAAGDLRTSLRPYV
jgi:hypothetical protein